MGGNNWINQGVHKICQLKMFWTMDEISCMKWLVHPFHCAYILLSTSVLTPPNLHGTLKNGFRLGAMLLSDGGFRICVQYNTIWWPSDTHSMYKILYMWTHTSANNYKHICKHPCMCMHKVQDAPALLGDFPVFPFFSTRSSSLFMFTTSVDNICA